MTLLLALAVLFSPNRVWGQPPNFIEEEAAYQQALQYIEQHRKNNVTITVLDQTGRPMSNINVSYQQTSHDFMFGFWGTGGTLPADNDTQGLAWYSHLCRAVNGTIILHEDAWNVREPEPSVFQWHADDMRYQQILNLCSNARIVVLFDSNAEIPDWVHANNLTDPAAFSLYKQDLYTYIHQYVERYGSRVSVWLTENELNEDPDFTLFGGLERGLEVDQVEIKAIRDVIPHAQILFQAGGSSSYIETLGRGPIDFAQKALAAGLQVDGISIEAYPRASDGFVHTPVFFRDLVQRARLTLDEPVLIQETGYPSQGCPGCASQWAAWDGVFDEATESAWVKYMTAIPFGTEDAIGVNFFSAIDAAYARSPAPSTDPWAYMGLFTLGRTKLAYNVYLQQIRTFTTLSSNITDAEGSISFRGFAGYYSLTVTASKGVSFPTFGPPVYQLSLHIHVQQLSNSTCVGQQNFRIAVTMQPTVSDTVMQSCINPTMSSLASSSTSSSSQLPLTVQYPWQGSIGEIVLAAVVVVILGSIFVSRRRKS